MKEAGFADAAKVGRWRRLIGSVAYYKAAERWTPFFAKQA